MSEDSRSLTRPIWLAIIMITAAMVAAGVGVVLHLAGATTPNALGAAGAAFVATATLCMTVWTFLTS
jgi:hypothetical protein